MLYDAEDFFGGISREFGQSSLSLVEAQKLKERGDVSCCRSSSSQSSPLPRAMDDEAKDLLRIIRSSTYAMIVEFRERLARIEEKVDNLTRQWDAFQEVLSLEEKRPSSPAPQPSPPPPDNALTDDITDFFGTILEDLGREEDLLK